MTRNDKMLKNDKNDKNDKIFFSKKKKLSKKEFHKKNLSKTIKNSIKNKMTTNRPTDRQTDIAAYRVAQHATKNQPFCSFQEQFCQGLGTSMVWSLKAHAALTNIGLICKLLRQEGLRNPFLSWHRPCQAKVQHAFYRAS